MKARKRSAQHYAYRCSVCNKPFLTVPRVRGHIRRLHGQNPIASAQRFECSDEEILALRGKGGQLPLWIETEPPEKLGGVIFYDPLPAVSGRAARART